MTGLATNRKIATKRRLALALCALIATAVSCAKPVSPPGGIQDRTPPRLVSTTPAALAVVPGFNKNIVFTFNETLSERGVNDAVVSVSPQPRGKVHARRKGNRIEVSADGGWERNQVYRVIIAPSISDRFNNARKEPVEIVFSTGPPIQNTAIAGLITDRITGRSTIDAAVEAVRRGDSARYTSVVDTAGFFALRYVPAGVYDVRGFQDANHNHRRDPSEAYSVSHQVALGATDTIPTELVLLPADTTGPELKRAVFADSLHITLSFDDAIDNEGGLASAVTSLTRVSDGLRVGGTIFTQLKNIQQRADQKAAAAAPPRVPPADTTTRRAPGTPPRTAPRTAPRTRADSMRVDSMRMDSLRNAAERDRAAAGVNTQGRGGYRPAAADTMPLPDRDVVITISAPLAPGKYRATISGVRNVNGLTGGGTADFDVKAVPVKPPIPKAPGDTSHIQPVARRPR